jgi:hypothetical protein
MAPTLNFFLNEGSQYMEIRGCKKKKNCGSSNNLKPNLNLNKHLAHGGMHLKCKIAGNLKRRVTFIFSFLFGCWRVHPRPQVC